MRSGDRSCNHLNRKRLRAQSLRVISASTMTMTSKVSSATVEAARERERVRLLALEGGSILLIPFLERRICSDLMQIVLVFKVCTGTHGKLWATEIHTLRFSTTRRTEFPIIIRDNREYC